MLKLNYKGLLVPSQNIKSSKEEMYLQFVTIIFSDKRNLIFEKYERYSKELAQITEILNPLQWIDGSFTTSEVNPNDMDLVTFLPYEIVDTLGKDLNSFKYPGSIEKYGLDAYIVKVYPKGHSCFALYAGDRTYWMDLFTKTKINRKGNKYSKGFLEIGTESYYTENEKF